MIPDFPQIKEQFKKLMMLSLKEQINEVSSMTSNASKKILFEGNKMGILREDGRLDITEMKRIQVSFTLNNDEILGLTKEELDHKIRIVAEEVARQQTQIVLNVVDDAVKETGNVISSPDGLSPKWILEALRRMEISFVNDDRNQPKVMQLYAAQEVIDKFKKNMDSLSEEEQKRFHQEYEAIMDVKYTEYLADLNSRKLDD